MNSIIIDFKHSKEKRILFFKFRSCQFLEANRAAATPYSPWYCDFSIKYIFMGVKLLIPHPLVLKSVFFVCFVFFFMMVVVEGVLLDRFSYLQDLSALLFYPKFRRGDTDSCLFPKNIS